MSLPIVRIGNVPVPRLILGHLPFVGESYQGTERNQELVTTFSKSENTMRVISRAVTNYGVTAMAVTPGTEGRLSRLLLDAIRKVIKITMREISLLPCFRIPLSIDEKPVVDYRRWVTYYNYESDIAGRDLLMKYINDPILRCRKGWEKKFPKTLGRSRHYTDEEIDRMQINYEGLEEATASFQSFKLLLAEAGSESDFLTISGRVDLLEEFIHFLRQKLNTPIVLGIHHAGLTIPILEEQNVGVVGYITPVNSQGVLMLPTKDLALKAIHSATKPVIAIKPMAGGRIAPKKAFEYIFNKIGVNASMIGVASEREVNQDFQTAIQVLDIIKT